MKIVVLDADSYGKDIDLSGFSTVGTAVFFPNTEPEQVSKRIKDADIVVINNVKLTNKDISSAVHLKLIAFAATGMDNIDNDYCRQRGIALRNVKGYATESVAQHTFAMLFALLHQTQYYDHFIKSGQWSKSGISTHLERKFHQLSGKQWGIIGMGAIGKRVAELATAFGCHVVYYKRSGSKTAAEYQGVTLQELLSRSHIISIHAPLNRSTKNLISRKELERIRDGGILVNVGRGGIINEKDLAEAVDARELYAGLDVYTREPLPADNPLLQVAHKERLLLTPHIAFGAVESRNLVIAETVKNIRNFIGT